MNIIKEINADPEHIKKLVDGIMRKLIPKQLGYLDNPDYNSAIIKVAEFMVLTGFPYRPDASIQQKVKDRIEKNLSGFILEGVKDEMKGYSMPLDRVFSIASWGIAADGLSITVDLDERLFPIFNFEFFYYDYGNVLSLNDPVNLFPSLDMIFEARLYGFEEQLKEQQPDNPYYRICTERPSRKATKTDIERYIEEPSARKLAFFFLEHPGDEGMTFSIPDGTILYINTPPPKPRKISSLEEITVYLTQGVEKAAGDFCEKGKYFDAENLIARRTRVKEFLGSDLVIPQKLVDHNRSYFGSFDPETVKNIVAGKVRSYNSHSISYGLDIPDNFTFAEYCFFRYMEVYVELSRKGVYNTPEKRKLVDSISDVLTAVLRMGYQETLAYEKLGSPRD